MNTAVDNLQRISLEAVVRENPSYSEESQIDNKSDKVSNENVIVPGDHGNGTFKSTARSFGIRKAELMTAQYNKPFLKAIFYFSTFLCAYCYGLDGTIRYTFQTYATNSYAQHSLFTTVGVIRSVVAAASQPAYARLSDQFGRLELFIVSIIFYAVGTVIESQAYDVQRFAGGAVLYQIGYSGVMLLLEVSLSDMSQLNWRLFASFVPALPFIINTWVSGNVAQSLLDSHSWNYAIGIFAFIFPLACIPLLVCYLHMRIAAGRTEEWKTICEEEKAEKQGRNVVVDLFWKLDVVGLLLIVCVFGLILVPFTLAGNKTTIFVSAKETWKKAYVIAPLVIGFCLIPALIFWEAKFAKFPVIPFPLLKDRGVWSALAIACFINFIWYMPNDFIYTVLVVGMNASIKAATRISSLYSFVSVITGPILGLVIVRVRRTKYFILGGCAIWFVAMGILLHFRGSNDGIEYTKYQNGVIGGLCLFGFGAGFFTYTTQLSIQTCTNHEYMSVVLSLYLASYNIGSAFGTAVSGAVWTQLMPNEIVIQMSKLGVDTSLAGTAYQAPFTFILTNPWGSPGRIAVALAYANIQRKLCIVGICLCVPLLVFAIFLRNHYLTDAQSLDEKHKNEGEVKGGKEGNKDVVVVNNFDDDPIYEFFRGLFKGEKSEN